MAQKNRTCISCGTKYSYCPSCSRAAALEPLWKAEFCSESCMTLWTTLTKYNMEFMTKEEAKAIVSALNIESMDTYADCVKRDYAKVMVEEKKPHRFAKKIEQPEEVVIVHEVVEE